MVTAELTQDVPVSGWRGFVERHGRKLWWLHSAYAMALGACVVAFAQRGFRHARWLTLTLVLAWTIIVVLFRVAGTGRDQNLESRRAQLGFLAATYVLKNLFQGMLFFLLPFYWKTATFDAPNRWFLVLLAACTLMATMDLVFDRVLMRWRLLASVYYVMALFAALNLALPALLPMAAVWSLTLAAGIAMVSFWTLQFGPRTLRNPGLLALLLALVGAAVGGAYSMRRWVPPVPLTLANAAVGPGALPGGRSGLVGDRLALQVTALHASLMHEMVAVTEVQTLSRAAEDFVHVWRHEGVEMHREAHELQLVNISRDRVSLKSGLAAAALPADPVGWWAVDVETDHGQLGGRVEFEVTR